MPEKARNLRMIMDNLLNPQSKASIGDLIKQAEQLMGEKIPSAVSPDKSARNAVDYISKYLVRPGVSERCIDSQQIMLDTRGNNGLGDNSLVIMENHDRVLKEGDENRIVITTESTSSRTYIDNDGKTNRLEVSKARSSGPVKKYSENKYVAEINPKSNKLDVLSENTAQEHFENEPKVISKKALEISVPEGGLNKKTLVEALSKHNELENENVDAKEPGAM